MGKLDFNQMIDNLIYAFFVYLSIPASNHETFKSYYMEIGGNLASFVSVTITAITVITGVIVYLFQRRQNTNHRFNLCASSLQKDNEQAQITAAILLRSFLKKRYYKSDALNLISALLRVTPYGNLQKTLADGLSYVRKAEGKDFQYANLHKVSIKSKDQIKYEVTKCYWYRRLQKFRGADFYRADITESSIYSVDFNKAVFFDALLYNTAFHNCTFYRANFTDADLRNVLFDRCKLDGVNFSGAFHVDSVLVKPGTKLKDNNEEGISILHFLNEKGVFGKYHDSILYCPPIRIPRVFISHLGMMDSFQTTAMRDITGWLKTNLGLQLSDISRKNYRDSGQLISIKNEMEKSCGVVILAFSYLNVNSGTIHEIKGNSVCSIRNTSFSSPWIQIEAAIARSMGLPCLVFVEKGVLHNGFFDEKLVRNDGGMYLIEYHNSTVALSSNDKRKIRAWHKKVLLLTNSGCK